MSRPRIPERLSAAADENDDPGHRAWLSGLPATIETLATDWGLKFGEPYLPGGQCAWVAPAVGQAGEALALKVGWRHVEAEHEAEALRFWDGDGAVRCLASRALGDTSALLLERCVPGTTLAQARPEPEQDVVLAGLLRRLWARRPPPGHPFVSLEEICAVWADAIEGAVAGGGSVDPGLAREGAMLLRELPATAPDRVLLCVDLHAGNVLAAEREPWLAIDPKPFVGDPAFDAVQHILNCDDRLAADPVGLVRRMAELLEVDAERVRLWLLARCAQESVSRASMGALARRVARAR